MSNKHITLELRPEDAEPILREAAEDAAKFGAWCDYLTPRTWNAPYRVDDDERKRWHGKFVRAKRIVEAFGLEHEATSEGETLTIDYPMKNEKRKRRVIAGLLAFTEVSGGEVDYKRPQPSYRRHIHAEACRQAADRVVRRWRAMLGGA